MRRSGGGRVGGRRGKRERGWEEGNLPCCVGGGRRSADEKA